MLGNKQSVFKLYLLGDVQQMRTSASADKVEEGKFFSILCRRPLWTAPYWNLNWINT